MLDAQPVAGSSPSGAVSGGGSAEAARRPARWPYRAADVRETALPAARGSTRVRARARYSSRVHLGGGSPTTDGNRVIDGLVRAGTTRAREARSGRSAALRLVGLA